MYPAMSGRNLTPSSTAASGPESGMPGAAVVGQIEQGQLLPLELVTAMLKARVALCCGVLESATRTVKLNVPTVLGVPLIVPVVLLSVSPVGSEPLETD